MYALGGLCRMSELVWWVGGVAQVRLSLGRPYSQIVELATKSIAMPPNRTPSGAQGFRQALVSGCTINAIVTLTSAVGQKK